MTTAWILSGGASLGAIQVGQAAALMAAGIVPDVVIGTSAGSLNAAWLAADPTPAGNEMLARLWLGVRRAEIFPFRPLTAGLGALGRRDHLVPSGALTRWLETHLPYRRLEEARIPLTVTATDLTTGQTVYLSRGPAIPALVASCAIPGLFPPVRLDGRILVDGGLTVEAPIESAIAAGADRIYVLPTLGDMPAGPPRSAGHVALRSLNLLLGTARHAALEPWADRADIMVLPAPSTEGCSPFSFRHGARLMEGPGSSPPRGSLSSPVAPVLDDRHRS